MIKRHLEKKIKEALKKYKIVTLLGPRQSGKTTLAQIVGKKFEYYNFEDLSFKSRFLEDPKGFFEGLKKNSILDEIQSCPEVLSFLQIYTDKIDYTYKFILTGSNGLLLNEKISQSLAGRTRLFYVLPFSYSEIPSNLASSSLNEALFKGGYPRIYWQDLKPTEWIPDYVQTYIQKDVRQIINIENILFFDKFLRLLAGRVGQILNYASFSNEIGVSIPTIKKWLGVLEASFVVYQLWPHFKNFNKRLTKAPKVYFYDTAIVCFLLRITQLKILQEHPLRGNIFENWAITEKIKNFYNKGDHPPYYFWRDQHGHEIDLVEDQGTFLYLIEIKSSSTFHPDFLKNIQWLQELQKLEKEKNEEGEVIYGGEESFLFLKKYKIKSWKKISS